MTLFDKIRLFLYLAGALYYFVWLTLKYREEDRNIAMSAMAAFILALVWPLWILYGFLMGVLNASEG